MLLLCSRLTLLQTVDRWSPKMPQTVDKDIFIQRFFSEGEPTGLLVRRSIGNLGGSRRMGSQLSPSRVGTPLRRLAICTYDVCVFLSMPSCLFVK